jgi:hypothetical protein
MPAVDCKRENWFGCLIRVIAPSLRRTSTIDGVRCHVADSWWFTDSEPGDAFVWAEIVRPGERWTMKFAAGKIKGGSD